MPLSSKIWAKKWDEQLAKSQDYLLKSYLQIKQNAEII